MTIAKVIELTGLTRKAIRYYESTGLIEPEVRENGYREYSQEIAERLILIKTLRNFYFSVEEIHDCLKDENSLLTCFSKKSKQLQEDREHLSMVINLLNEFVSGDHSLEEITKLHSKIEQVHQTRSQYLRYRLRQLFPGPFGEILAAAYGNFLDDSISTSEQRDAWDALISELDELDPITVPENLVVWARNHNNQELIQENYLRMTEEYAQDYDEFAYAKRKAVQEYLEIADKTEIADRFRRAQDLSKFLAKEGKAVVEVFSKYLPILSKQFQRFALMQSRFINDNPDLTAQLR